MNVYRRYFHILDTETRAEINRLWAIRKAYTDGLLEIQESIGAKELHHYTRDGTIAGFGFDKTPDLDVFKRVNGGLYMPRKSNSKGKMIQSQIDAFTRPADINDALKTVIPTHRFSLHYGLVFYNCAVFGMPENHWYASVPWAEVDPAELNKYRADHEAGKQRESNFEHLLWTPPREWAEVKEWAAQRAIDEAKQKAKETNDSAA